MTNMTNTTNMTNMTNTTNILSLPDEVLRNIICKLPIDSFTKISISCVRLDGLRLTKLLIPFRIDGIGAPDETLSSRDRRRYSLTDKKRGPLYCMYDTLAQLAIIIGDFCMWDYYDVNQHDFIYLMLRTAQKPWHLIINPLHLQERSRLTFDNIALRYHCSILNSLTLRALV